MAKTFGGLEPITPRQ